MSVLSTLFLALTLVLTGIRVTLELTAVEAITGFYSESGWLVIVQNVLFVLAVLAIALLTRRAPRGCTMRFDRFSKPLAILLGLAGALLGVSAVLDLAGGRTFAFPENMAGAAGAMAVELVARVLSIPAAAAMLAMAVSLLLSGGFRWGLWGSALIALWMTVDVISRFLSYPTIVSISDQTLEVVTVCMGALFWLSHARVTSAELIESVPRHAKLWSLLFALFAVPTCAGQLAALVSGNASAVHMALPRQIVLLALGIYAALWGTSMRFHSPSRRYFS